MGEFECAYESVERCSVAMSVLGSWSVAMSVWGGAVWL